jgi:hypothetical protein
MTSVIRSPKDFWLGLIYTTTGAAGLWFARELPFGTGARMGAGYFPTVISVVLLLFGLIALVRAILIAGEPVGAIAWKAVPLIIGAVVVFGMLIENAGLIAAGVALLLMCAITSTEFRFGWIALLGAVALVAVCALLFIYGLGLPIPTVGPWLKAIMPGAGNG